MTHDVGLSTIGKANLTMFGSETKTPRNDQNKFPGLATSRGYAEGVRAIMQN